MGLDLKIAGLHDIAPRGRRAAPLDYEYSRDLTEADIALLEIPGSIEAPTIKKITERHHSLARCLASGMNEGEAAMQVGYTASRVSTLKKSPAFQELFALYEKEVREEFISTIRHMAGLTQDAVMELRDRLEESPERFSNADLRQIAVDFNDRVSRADPNDSTVPMPDLIELVAYEKPADDKDAD